MDMINIKVRKEVIRCKKCNRPKAFLYLSDFSYGQKLLFLNNATEYAFINLIEDEYFSNYADIVKKILLENSIEFTKDMINDFVNETYGVTCDWINGQEVDFSQKQKKCSFCGSTEFERNMIEPESLIEIEVPLISHIKWESISEEERVKIVMDELKFKNII